MSFISKHLAYFWHSRFVSRRVAILFLLLSLIIASSVPGLAATKPVEILSNGGFEEGFYTAPVGAVGNGWGWFTNGGRVNYGFSDDQWDKVVFEGEHSQRIEMNTFGISDASTDRFVGIYQSVEVVAGETYNVDLRRLIRSNRQRGDRWAYMIQVGWTDGKTADWTAVSQWLDAPRSTFYPRGEPGNFRRFRTTITPQDSSGTLYIRIWKKWGHSDVGVDVNLDAISLKGPPPS
jgi:hypothetical protein